MLISFDKIKFSTLNTLIIIFAYYANVRIWLILGLKMSCFSHFRVFWVVVEEGGSWYFAYRCGICNGGGGRKQNKHNK